MATNVYTEINTLLDELGTAEDSRQELTQKISDFEQELDDLDKLAEDATSREEYENIIAQRNECTLDLRFARNRLRLFDQSPRIDPEKLTELFNRLSAEADSAANRYRQKVENPVAEIVKAGDEFNQTIDAIGEAVSTLATVTGPAYERNNSIRELFYRVQTNTLRSRAFKDNCRIVHPALRDALNLASTAKQPAFDTH